MSRSNDKFFRNFWTIFTTILVANIILIAAIIFVAVHFISKFW